MAETFRPYGDTPAIESNDDSEIDSGIAESTESSPEGVSQIYDANGQHGDNGGPVDSLPPSEMPDSNSVETHLGNVALDGSGVEDPGGGMDDVPQADQAADVSSRSEGLGGSALDGARVEDSGGEIDSQAIPNSTEASDGTTGTDFGRSDQRDDGDESDVLRDTAEGASPIDSGDPESDSIENLEAEDDLTVEQESDGQTLIRIEAEETADATSTNETAPDTDPDVIESQNPELEWDAPSPELPEPGASHEKSDEESESPPDGQDIAPDPPRDESASSAEDGQPTIASLDGDTSEGGHKARSDVAAEDPDLYQKVDAPPPNVDSPHEPPENWAPEINPGGGNENCGDCSRATEQTWEGDPKVASVGGPEDDSVMSRWAGADLESTSPDAINDKLAEMGPGSSAIIGCNWEDGGGHWFNAVNDSGTVKAVDGQSGQVESWPPSDSGLGFNPADMKNVEAIYLDSNGKVVK